MALLAPPPTPICRPLKANASPIRVRFPFGIQLESARSALNKVTTADEILMDLLKQINSVLAPTAPIVSLAGVAVSLINFAKSVPDAISSLSPDPIITALDDLRKKAMLLPQFIPGMPYVILVRDIFKVTRTLLMALKELNETTRTALERQARIVTVIEGFGQQDANLSAILDCNLRDLNRRMENISLGLGLLRTLLTGIAALLSLIETFLPKPAARSIKNVRCSMGDLITAELNIDLDDDPAEVIAAHEAVLDQNNDLIDGILTVVAALEEILATAIGESAGAEVAAADVFGDCE